MRTTIEIGDALFVQAKKAAAAHGVPFRQIVEDALRKYLKGSPKSGGYKLRWGSEGGELLPGVDLEDHDSLIETMEGRK